MIGLLKFINPATIIEGVNTLAKTFVGDKSARDAQQAQSDVSSRATFAAEFQAPEKQNLFNALIDGVNRLPRPMIIFMIIWYISLSVRSPYDFQAINLSLETIPDPIWQIIFAIISFLFVAREFQVGKKLALSKKEFADLMQRHRELLDMKRAGEAGDTAAAVNTDVPILPEKEFQEQMADTSKPLSNKAIEEWNRRRNGQ